MKKPSAVLDTNVLVSGFILPKSRPAQILHLWRKQKVEVITSTPMIQELEAVLQYPKLRKKYSLDTVNIDRFVRQVQKRSTYSPVIRKPAVFIRDPKDLVVLGTALSGKADFLVTGDKDLLSLKHHPKLGRVKIVTVSEFLTRIEE
jgi:putative PIN family toxin of toxin-antitoxin system